MKRMEMDLEKNKETESNIYEEIKLECIKETLCSCFKECFDYLNSRSGELLNTVCEAVRYFELIKIIIIFI